MKIKVDSVLGRFAIRLLYPELRVWLEERALRIPAARRQELAKRLKVKDETVVAVEDAVRELILEALDSLVDRVQAR